MSVGLPKGTHDPVLVGLIRRYHKFVRPYATALFLGAAMIPNNIGHTKYKIILDVWNF